MCLLSESIRCYFSAFFRRAVAALPFFGVGRVPVVVLIVLAGIAVAFQPVGFAQGEAEASLLAPDQEGAAMVDQIIFRDETTDQVLHLLERLTGRSIIRPQALPAATFTFNSQQPMTREEAILALESMLSINGIGVAPLGELFLKVVPLARLRTEAPEFLMESTLGLPPSGRIVSRMIYLEFLGIDEIQSQLNLMITAGSGSIIPFPKANALLITDTVSNLQAIEELLEEVDRPFVPHTETKFFPIQFARAEELLGQIQLIAGLDGVPELSARTKLIADERSNQIIIIADRRQMEMYEDLIGKLDVRAELTTRNEVIFLKHANAVDVASILSQLAGGSGGGFRTGTGGGAGGTGGLGGTAGRRTGGSSRGGIGQGTSRGGLQQNRNMPGSSGFQQNRGNQPRRAPQVPQIPGVRAQQAAEGAAPAGGEGATAADESGLTAGMTDFSETLSIMPDERTNAIIVSGTKQDIALITELIDKIDIVLAQVRIEAFIAEVTLDKQSARGIDKFGLQLSRDDVLTGSVEGPGFVIGRAKGDLDWSALFSTAEGDSSIRVFSVPSIVTTHNREARILVGEQRPIITGTVTDSFNTTSTRSQIQYRDIGTEIFVLPLIGNDGTIQLEIEQIVEDVIGEIKIDGNDQPIIGKREANSFISVANGETVILGGLQSTSDKENESRLGILGQLPILGNIFRAKGTEQVRRELLVFIRPIVLPDPSVAYRDTQEQIEGFSEAARLRHRIDSKRYPDPDAPGHSEEARALREESLRYEANPEREPYRWEVVPESEPVRPEPVPMVPEVIVPKPLENRSVPEREETSGPSLRRRGVGSRM